MFQANELLYTVDSNYFQSLSAVSCNTLPLPLSRLYRNQLLLTVLSQLQCHFLQEAFPDTLNWVKHSSFDYHLALSIVLTCITLSRLGAPKGMQMVFALLTLILSAQHMVNPQYILLDEQLCDHIPFFNFYCYEVNIT